MAHSLENRHHSFARQTTAEMKTAIVLFLCVAYVSAKGLSDEEKEAYHKECLPQSGVSEDLVMKAMGGEFTDDPKFKAYLLCFGKKMGFHDDAGGFRRDVIRDKLSSMVSDAAAVDKMMECAVDKGSPEDSAFEAAKCIYAFKHELMC